ncbi:MAG: thiamine phosphate synthase [Deltaproteobacteria bacterium]|nr:thiamine phosphate synthase [Deltaproteobacteria bacterium]
MQVTDFRLYLITDRQQTCGRPLPDVVRQALDGGVKAVQLREKDLSGAELYRLAEELRQLTSDYGARLIINDRLDVALAVAADGVHIGIGSMPVAAVRRLLGPDRIIGYSAHAAHEALLAQAEGADFVTFGPLYHTPSKAAYGAPCGIEMLSEAVHLLEIPVIALGGITPENISGALSSGAHGIALISAVMAAYDPCAAAAALLKKIHERVS